MSNTEDRQLSVLGTIESRAKDGKNKIVGYAAVFDSLSEDLGGYREIIRRNAFDDTLAEDPDVSARVQHDGGMQTVGRTANGTLALSTDEKGLWYEATLPDTQAGRDIFTLVRDGFIDKSSFAFSVRDGGQMWHYEDEPPIRELLSVDLYDVAPVDGPAYQATTVEARSLAIKDMAARRGEEPEVKPEPDPEPEPKELTAEEEWVKLRLSVHEASKRERDWAAEK